MSSAAERGRVLWSHRQCPDPEKIRAIKDMSPPTSVSELRTVCWMQNYLTKFVPHMTTTLKPVTDLLKGNRAWLCGPAQQQTFDSAKKKLSKSPALGFYDPQRQTVVSADSSSYGLGATIMQMDASGQLISIAYASRTMTDAEKKYAQIEKECLAATWASEKFSKYLIGADRFELQTDHKPLVPLIKTKDIDNVPVRCQRLLIRLMRFNADVCHVPGKEIVIVDALYRSPVPHTAEDEEVTEVVTAYVDGVMDNQQITPRRIEALQSETVHDPEQQQVISYILNGWSQSVAEQFQPYQQAQGDLSVVDGLVVFNNRIVVPVSQRKDILHKLHETHQGLYKCRQNAQATVWWPGLSKELKELVDACRECRANRPVQRWEPLHPTDLPERPWQKLGADLCALQGKDFLVVTDYYSRWLEVRQLHSTTASSIINKFNMIFSTHGIPEVVVSDKGPQFQCREFHGFAQEYDFQHQTSSPGFTQANALLNYRATPHSSTRVSPAAALMGRQFRTKLPILPNNLQPSHPGDGVIRRADGQAKEDQQQSYDRRHGVVPLAPLKPGESVRIRTDAEQCWSTEGTVVAANTSNRTYLVNSPGGVV